MIKRIRVGLKEELLVGSGRIGRPAVSQSICLSRFHPFCIVGLVSVGLAFSAAARFVSTNTDAAVSYAASGRGTMSVLATEARENNQSPPETLTNKSDRKLSERNAAPNPNVGVELVCGLALFLWVQRFRNSLF
jgi:hypothetical protein